MPPEYIQRREFNDTCVRIFDKMEEHQCQINTKLTTIVTDQAAIKTRLDLMPDMPTQPCEEFVEHIREHKSRMKPFATGAIGACFALIVKWIWETIGKG